MTVRQPALVRADVVLTRASASTGWTDTIQLRMLGRTGRILTVKVREDNTDEYADAAVLFIADATGALSSSVDDLDVVYESASIGLTASLNAASLQDALTVPAPYAVGKAGDLRVAANITSGTGSNDTKLHVTILAEVWS